MQAAGDACALEWILSLILFPEGNKTGHFNLGNSNFLTTPISQADIGNLIIHHNDSIEKGGRIP